MSCGQHNAQHPPGAQSSARVGDIRRDVQRRAVCLMPDGAARLSTYTVQRRSFAPATVRSIRSAQTNCLAWWARAASFSRTDELAEPGLYCGLTVGRAAESAHGAEPALLTWSTAKEDLRSSRAALLALCKYPHLAPTTWAKATASSRNASRSHCVSRCVLCGSVPKMSSGKGMYVCPTTFFGYQPSHGHVSPGRIAYLPSIYRNIPRYNLIV